MSRLWSGVSRGGGRKNGNMDKTRILGEGGARCNGPRLKQEEGRARLSTRSWKDFPRFEKEEEKKKKKKE
jgi:hypothetical protein